jgi:hypothetical protein
MTITGTITKPSDFFAFVPQKANYPLICEGNQIRLAYGAPPSVVFKYSTFKPLLTGTGDTILLPDYCISEIVDYVVLHYRDDIGEDDVARLAQSTNLYSSDESLLFSAKGG